MPDSGVTHVSEPVLPICPVYTGGGAGGGGRHRGGFPRLRPGAQPTKSLRDSCGRSASRTHNARLAAGRAVRESPLPFVHLSASPPLRLSATPPYRFAPLDR